MATENAHPETDDESRQAAPQPLGKTEQEATAVSKPMSLRRLILLSLAGGAFLLGALGTVLPILPTTPFLLLTSYFLARSSPRLNAALLHSRFFGPILTDWQEHRGVRRDIKLKAVTVVICTVGASIYLTAASSIVAVGVISLALIGIIVILRLPNAQ
jgi:uncharacterized membrane protein YbaN (DUF454 family)